MITPLPLPDRPSCRLTWIEYRPFFMMSRGTTSIPAVSICCYAKAEHTASTRQVGCTFLVDRILWNPAMLYDTEMTATSSIPAVSICCYAKAEHTASTRQVGCTFLVDRILWNPAMLYDTEMTATSAFPELAHEMHGHPCTGRVLEQATGERLDRFRRPRAVF